MKIPIKPNDGLMIPAKLTRDAWVDGSVDHLTLQLPVEVRTEKGEEKVHLTATFSGKLDARDILDAARKGAEVQLVATGLADKKLAVGKVVIERCVFAITE